MNYIWERDRGSQEFSNSAPLKMVVLIPPWIHGGDNPHSIWL